MVARRLAAESLSASDALAACCFVCVAFSRQAEGVLSRESKMFCSTEVYHNLHERGDGRSSQLDISYVSLTIGSLTQPLLCLVTKSVKILASIVQRGIAPKIRLWKLLR